MNIFHMFPAKAPETRSNEHPTMPESSPSGRAPLLQRIESAVGSGPTKADEIVRLMAERKGRFKKTS
jgi:hypothetical protein